MKYYSLDYSKFMAPGRQVRTPIDEQIVNIQYMWQSYPMNPRYRNPSALNDLFPMNMC